MFLMKTRRCTNSQKVECPDRPRRKNAYHPFDRPASVLIGSWCVTVESQNTWLVPSHGADDIFYLVIIILSVAKLPKSQGFFSFVRCSCSWFFCVRAFSVYMQYCFGEFSEQNKINNKRKHAMNTRSRMNLESIGTKIIMTQGIKIWSTELGYCRFRSL